MKRVVVFCFLLLIAAGCNRSNYLTEEKFSEKNDKIEKELSEIKTIVTRGTIGNKPEVQSYIIIDKSLLPSVSAWKAEVANLITASPGEEILNEDIITLETDDYCYVDVNLISKLYEKKIADWLMKNDKYIKFPESYWLIETAHKVQEKFERKDLDTIKDASYTQIDWADIKDMMDKESITLGSINNYDRFLQIDFNASAHHNIIASNFSTDPMFSFPLLNSIFMNHHQSANLKFWFVRSKYRSGQKTVVLKVMDGTDFIGYYDFTHRPRYVVNPWY